MNILKPALLLIFLVFNTLTNAKQDLPSFTHIDDPKAHIEQEFSLAAQQSKHVLFVLGGNWCHDSQSLATKLKDNSLNDTMNKHYRVSMIDVGYLEHGFEFTELSNMATFYATPTVLIFDAKTRRLLNANNHHQWAHAYKISQTETNEYFEQYAHQSDLQNTANLGVDLAAEKTAKLAQFKTLQELRIKNAYSVVGPLLKAYKEKQPSENFDGYWNELRELRMQLPEDLEMLRLTIEKEPNKPLTLPSYSKFTWE